MARPRYKAFRPSSKAKQQFKQMSERDGYSIKSRMVIGLGSIALLVVAIGGWAASADLSGAIIAQGKVVVDHHVKMVQHNDGGIVSKILVSNGDEVRTGQTLIRLDDTQINAEIGVVRSQLSQLIGRRHRLIAERDDRDEITFPKDFSQQGGTANSIIKGERRLFMENRKDSIAKKKQLRLRIEQVQEEKKGLIAQRNAKKRELQLIRKEVARIHQLHDKRLVSSTRVFSIEREQARINGELGNLVAQIARTGGKISEINVQILAEDQLARTDAQKQLRAIEGRVSELRERLFAAQDRLNRIELRAPQSGIVHELSAHTIGGVITPAQQIMLIVPQNEALSVEARLLPIDIDQVVIGKHARLRFSAFNQRTTPELNGRVSKISADLSMDESGRLAYYVARISIDEASRGLISNRKLIPGMPVEVFITTDKRKALSYFAKPFTDLLERAFREQ